MIERPAEHWEGRSAAALAAEWGAPEVRLYASVGSTNDVVRRLAEEGAPEGTVVLAERQLAGRGRAGREWESPEGLGLWLSLLLRPAALPAPGALPLRVGLAVAEALDPVLAPARAELKWPNDLLCEGRKLGGILCEAVWEGAGPAFVVVGVGVNLLHLPADFPPELRGGATSVRIASGRAPDRGQVAAAVVRALGALRRGTVELSPAGLAAIQDRDALRGREVVVREPATGAPLAEGTALGVSLEGALVLRTRAGSLRSIHSGTVRLAE